MKGYVAKKGNRFYAVIYDGLELAADVNGRNDDVRALSFGAYLTTRWLPGKRLGRGHQHLGRLPPQDRPPHPPDAWTDRAIRRLRPEHLEALYDTMLHPTDGRKPLAPKTVLEVHLIIRGALADAVRKGLASRWRRSRR